MLFSTTQVGWGAKQQPESCMFVFLHRDESPNRPGRAGLSRAAVTRPSGQRADSRIIFPSRQVRMCHPTPTGRLTRGPRRTRTLTRCWCSTVAMIRFLESENTHINSPHQFNLFWYIEKYFILFHQFSVWIHNLIVWIHTKKRVNSLSYFFMLQGSFILK